MTKEELPFSLIELTEARLLLRHLFEHPDELDLYVLHQHYRLSPGQLSRVVRGYEECGFVREPVMGKLSLTPQGEQWILNNRLRVAGMYARQRWKSKAGEISGVTLEFRDEPSPTTAYRMRPRDLVALGYRAKASTKIA
jgi:hypothetical protein